LELIEMPTNEVMQLPLRQFRIVLSPDTLQELSLSHRLVFMECVDEHPDQRKFNFCIQCEMPSKRTWLLGTVQEVSADRAFVQLEQRRELLWGDRVIQNFSCVIFEKTQFMRFVWQLQKLGVLE
jgi:hypothetical protein